MLCGGAALCCALHTLRPLPFLPSCLPSICAWLPSFLPSLARCAALPSLLASFCELRACRSIMYHSCSSSTFQVCCCPNLTTGGVMRAAHLISSVHHHRLGSHSLAPSLLLLLCLCFTCSSSSAFSFSLAAGPPPRPTSIACWLLWVVLRGISSIRSAVYYCHYRFYHSQSWWLRRWWCCRSSMRLGVPIAGCWGDGMPFGTARLVTTRDPLRLSSSSSSVCPLPRVVFSCSFSLPPAPLAAAPSRPVTSPHPACGRHPGPALPFLLFVVPTLALFVSRAFLLLSGAFRPSTVPHRTLSCSVSRPAFSLMGLVLSSSLLVIQSE
ncbi:hypothetical protein Mapa_002388 [Marchantia paleacea]|nr:hypothetical protein Mapa_002388 [Marchantia paleacea]